MRRPPDLNAVAIMSIARAICGIALFTAFATFASSLFKLLAISREDLRSRSREAAFDCSVPRRAILICLRFNSVLENLRLEAGFSQKQHSMKICVLRVTAFPLALRSPHHRTLGAL